MKGRNNHENKKRGINRGPSYIPKAPSVPRANNLQRWYDLNPHASVGDGGYDKKKADSQRSHINNLRDQNRKNEVARSQAKANKHLTEDGGSIRPTTSTFIPPTNVSSPTLSQPSSFTPPSNLTRVTPIEQVTNTPTPAHIFEGANQLGPAPLPGQPSPSGTKSLNKKKPPKVIGSNLFNSPFAK